MKSICFSTHSLRPGRKKNCFYKMSLCVCMSVRLYVCVSVCPWVDVSCLYNRKCMNLCIKFEQTSYIGCWLCHRSQLKLGIFRQKYAIFLIVSSESIRSYVWNWIIHIYVFDVVVKFQCTLPKFTVIGISCEFPFVSPDSIWNYG